MRKKLFAISLVTIAVLATVTGCKKDKNTTDNSTNETTGVAGSEDESREEPYKYTEKLADYSGYVTLGDYTGLTVEVDNERVTDKQLKDNIQTILDNNPNYEKITNRKVKDGDTIHLQYTGYLNDKKIDKATTGEAGTDYTIGTNYIKSLNDQLIGLECGKDYDLDCKFPDDYDDEELKGQAVLFKVKVDYIQGKEIEQKWTDDFVKTYSSGKYSTTAEFEEYMKEKLLAQNKENQLSSYQSQIIKDIMDKCEFKDLPQDKIDEAYESIFEYYDGTYKSMAEQYGMEYEELLKASGSSLEDLKKSCREQAELQVKYVIMTCAIAKKQNISVSQSDYDTNVGKYIEQTGLEMSKKEFVEKYGEAYLLETFTSDKVAAFLYENNNMKIKK